MAIAKRENFHIFDTINVTNDKHVLPATPLFMKNLQIFTPNSAVSGLFHPGWSDHPECR